MPISTSFQYLTACSVPRKVKDSTEVLAKSSRPVVSLIFLEDLTLVCDIVGENQVYGTFTAKEVPLRKSATVEWSGL